MSTEVRADDDNAPAEVVAGMCQAGIADADDALKAYCPPPTESSQVGWDAENSVCYRDTVSTFNDRLPPVTEFNVEILDNSECCTAEQPDACSKKFKYSEGSCTYWTVSEGEQIDAPEGKEDCCLEGWNTESDDLKAACDIRKTIFEYDGNICTLTLLDILPHVQDEKSATVTNESCCENANEDEILLTACSTAPAMPKLPSTNIFDGVETELKLFEEKKTFAAASADC